MANDVMKSLIIEVRAKTKQFEKGMDGVNRRTKQAGGLFGKTKGELAKFGAQMFAAAKAIQLVSRAFSTGITQAIEYQKSFAEVTTLLEGSETSFKGLSSAVLDLAGPLGSATELSKGLYQTISAGIDRPVDSMKFLTQAAKLAKAGMTDTKSAVDILSTALNAYGKSADEAQHVSDILFQTVKDGKTTLPELAQSLGMVFATSAKVGVKIPEVAAAMAVMTKKGINTAEASTALNAALTAILGPTEQARNVAKKYGIELSVAGIKGAGTFANYLKIMSKKMGGNIEDFKKMFPNIRAFKAVLSLTSKGAKEYGEEMVKMGNVHGNTDRAFNKTNSTFAALWDTVKNKLSAAFTKSLLPALENLVNLAGPGGGLDSVIEGMASLASATAKVTGVLIKTIAVIPRFLGLMDQLKRTSISTAASAMKNSTSMTQRYIKLRDELEKNGAAFSDIEEAMGNFDNGQRSSLEQLLKVINVVRKGSNAYPELEAAIVKTREAHRKELFAINKANEAKTKNKEITTKQKKVYKELADEVTKVPEIGETKLDENYLKQSEMGIRMVNDSIEKEIELLKDAGEELEFATEKATGMGNVFSGITGVMGGISSGIGVVTSTLSTLGVSMDGIGKDIMDIGSGAAQLASGELLGAVKIAVGLFKGLKKLFSGDGVGEAIKRDLGKGIKVTKEMDKKIRELAESTGNTHGAISTLFDEIINQGDVTAKNFDTYAKRVRGILSQLDQDVFDVSKTAAEIGDAFGALITKAKDLGTEGSKTIIELFEDLKGRGIEVAEVTEYINAQMERGLQGYKNVLKSVEETTAAKEVFGGKSIQIFEDMLAYENKVAENQALVDAIKGWEDSFIALSNTQRLTETQFDDFESAASAAYEKLIEQGFTSKEAMKLMAPQLQRLADLNREYGLTLDESTQKLLEEAKQHGVSFEKKKSFEETMLDISERQLDIFEKIARKMGVDIPRATQKMSNAMIDSLKRVGPAADDLAGKFSGLGGGKLIQDFERPPGPIISAATGYSGVLSQDQMFQAHKGERVEITPASKTMGGGKQGNILLNFKMDVHEKVDAARLYANFIEYMRMNKGNIQRELNNISHQYNLVEESIG
jgi:TP901 family phage tail tape measure protein